jgi:hypothetical protein
VARFFGATHRSEFLPGSYKSSIYFSGALIRHYAIQLRDSDGFCSFGKDLVKYSA